MLVAAARPVVRAGVVRLLQLGEPGLGMVSEVSDVSGVDDLANACRLLGPDVLVVEHGLRRLAAPSRPSGAPAITPREHEVRNLVARGLTDRRIARALDISAKTVEKHVGSLLRKTGTRNRTMLARLG